MNAALADLLVVDLTTVRSGPTCTKILADFGAEVIRVERPGESDRGRVFFDQADLHHTREVLARLSYRAQEVDALAAAGAIEVVK